MTDKIKIGSKWVRKADNLYEVEIVEIWGNCVTFMSSKYGNHAMPSELFSYCFEEVKPESQWRDISTAPKDETRILLSNLQGLMTTAFFSIPDGEWYDVGTDLAIDVACGYKPTHWQPLPPPPESKPNKEEE